MKKIIALILACALVVPSVCACSAEEAMKTVTEIGSQVYDVYENRDEIESVVTDIVGNQLDGLTEQANQVIEDVGAEAIEKIGDLEIPSDFATVEAPTEKASEMATEAVTEKATEAAKTNAKKETEKVTEAESKIEKETEKATEKVTEAETKAEKETEKETEKVTEAETKAEKETEKETEKVTESETKTDKKDKKDKEKKTSDDATGFVMVNDVADNIIQDMRYYSLYNELEERLPGYEQPVLLLTKEAAAAIKEVSDELYEDGYILKIYDAYRPLKAEEKLIDAGMGSILADHSRGSAVDVTLVDRKTGKELDMSGCAYGFINKVNLALTEEQKENQKILKDAMEDAGFVGDDEWYHFVLKDEPYKDTYFTFPINFKVAGKTAEEYMKDAKKERQIKFIIEFYDDGSVEVKTEPDKKSDDKTDKKSDSKSKTQED